MFKDQALSAKTYLPETVTPSNSAHGMKVIPSLCCSEDIATILFSMSMMLPLIIVSLTAGPILPFSIIKLFFATPEKSPFVDGCPPEKRFIMSPLSISFIMSSSEVLPGRTSRLRPEFALRWKPVLFAPYCDRTNEVRTPSFIISIFSAG